MRLAATRFVDGDRQEQAGGDDADQRQHRADGLPRRGERYPPDQGVRGAERPEESPAGQKQRERAADHGYEPIGTGQLRATGDGLERETADPQVLRQLPGRSVDDRVAEPERGHEDERVRDEEEERAECHGRAEEAAPGLASCRAASMTDMRAGLCSLALSTEARSWVTRPAMPFFGSLR